MWPFCDPIWGSRDSGQISVERSCVFQLAEKQWITAVTVSDVHLNPLQAFRTPFDFNYIYLAIIVSVWFGYFLWRWCAFWKTFCRHWCWNFQSDLQKNNFWVISLDIDICRVVFLCIYLMAIMFQDINSFEMICNIKVFDVKKGLLLRNKQSWEFLFDVLQLSEGLSYRDIYGKFLVFFLQQVLYKICNKVTLRRKYWCLHSILFKSWYIINSLTQW